MFDFKRKNTTLFGTARNVLTRSSPFIITIVVVIIDIDH